MHLKTKIKLGIDFLLTVLLLLLMAYQVVGEMLHEWFGAAMLVLFITHNILNINGNTPAVQEQSHRSIPKIPSAPRNPIILALPVY